MHRSAASRSKHAIASAPLDACTTRYPQRFRNVESAPSMSGESSTTSSLALILGGTLGDHTPSRPPVSWLAAGRGTLAGSGKAGGGALRCGSGRRRRSAVHTTVEAGVAFVQVDVVEVHRTLVRAGRRRQVGTAVFALVLELDVAAAEADGVVVRGLDHVR